MPWISRNYFEYNRPEKLSNAREVFFFLGRVRAMFTEEEEEDEKTLCVRLNRVRKAKWSDIWCFNRISDAHCAVILRFCFLWSLGSDYCYLRLLLEVCLCCRLSAHKGKCLMGEKSETIVIAKREEKKNCFSQHFYCVVLRGHCLLFADASKHLRSAIRSKCNKSREWRIIIQNRYVDAINAMIAVNSVCADAISRQIFCYRSYFFPSSLSSPPSSASSQIN